MTRMSRVVIHGDVGDGFTRVPNSLIRDRELSAGAARVILWLASQSEKRAIYRRDAALELGVSRPTHASWLADAERSPYLHLEPTGERDHQGNETHDYHVALAPCKETMRGRVKKLDTKKTREKTKKSKNTPPTFGRVAIDENWTPNRNHERTARRLGLDLPPVAALFKQWAGDGKEHSDWDSTFGAFLNAIADGTAETKFKGLNLDGTEFG